MPPSGFSTRSADGLATFLREALTDLRAEVKIGKHVNLEVGLRFEVSQISKALTCDCGQEERVLLVLTKCFYEEVLSVGEEVALQNASKRVLSIHIDEDGKLTSKH